VGVRESQKHFHVQRKSRVLGEREKNQEQGRRAKREPDSVSFVHLNSGKGETISQ